MPTITTLCTHNFLCKNVHSEPFYVHGNQCTQILNMLSPEICHIARPYVFFHNFCSIPKHCLHDMSSNQITFLFSGTHKLFHEPLFDILTPLLFTPWVFPQMVAFSFHKFIFDILSLATSFVTISQFSTVSIFFQVNDGFI